MRRTTVLLLAFPAVGAAAAEEPAHETVTFETADDITIPGDLWPSGKVGGELLADLYWIPPDRPLRVVTDEALAPADGFVLN